MDEKFIAYRTWQPARRGRLRTYQGVPIQRSSISRTSRQRKRWQLAPTSSKRQKSSEFRKYKNATCLAAAINRTCTRHPDRLMMTCSSTCHKKAKKQRRECSKSSLATLQPQTDTDMEYAEIAALGESKDFPVIAPTQLLHKRAMPEGSQKWHRQ